MSKKVYNLKHATPRMKYQHMRNMMEFKSDLKDKQANYNPESCPVCGNKRSLPLYLVGKTELCYGCYEDVKQELEREAVEIAETVAWVGDQELSTNFEDDMTDYLDLKATQEDARLS